MRMKSLTGAALALSLIAAPTMASAATANPAASLSLSKATRAGSSTSAKNHAAGGGVIFALAIVAGIAAIVIVDATKDDNDNSDSN